MKTLIIICIFSLASLKLSAQSQVIDAPKRNYTDTIIQSQDSTRNPNGNYQARPKSEMKNQNKDSVRTGKNSKATRSQPNSPIDTLRIDKTNPSKTIRDSVK